MGGGLRDVASGLRDALSWLRDGDCRFRDDRAGFRDVEGGVRDVMLGAGVSHRLVDGANLDDGVAGVRNYVQVTTTG